MVHTTECSIECKIVVVFFFKQKTAYEMRISDWSSDVCSSDLPRRDRAVLGNHRRRLPQPPALRAFERHQPDLLAEHREAVVAFGIIGRGELAVVQPPDRTAPGLRSEEHTSELQSLMRISSAASCLKKKNISNVRTTITTTHNKHTLVSEQQHTHNN